MQSTQPFERVWPQLSSELDTALARKRVSDWMRDDIIQETGLRLIKNWNKVDPARPLFPLAFTIALNLLRDEIRAAKRRQETAFFGLESQDCLEDEVIARLELADVRRAMTQLTPSQRSVLLTEFGEPLMAGSSSASVKMLRMRARRRLRAVMSRASGFAVGLRLRLRDVSERLDVAMMTRPLGREAGMIVPVVNLVGIVAFLGLGLGSAIDSTPLPRHNGAVPSEVSALSPSIYSITIGAGDLGNESLRWDARTTTGLPRSTQEPGDIGSRQGSSIGAGPVSVDAGVEGGDDSTIKAWLRSQINDGHLSVVAEVEASSDGKTETSVTVNTLGTRVGVALKSAPPGIRKGSQPA